MRIFLDFACSRDICVLESMISWIVSDSDKHSMPTVQVPCNQSIVPSLAFKDVPCQSCTVMILSIYAATVSALCFDIREAMHISSTCIIRVNDMNNTKPLAVDEVMDGDVRLDRGRSWCSKRQCSSSSRWVELAWLA